jgi:hypothetical protein
MGAGRSAGIVAVLVGTLVAVLVACGPATFELHGQVALQRLLAVPDGNGGCQGLRAYSDFRPGRPVAVYNATRVQVTMGSLGPGAYSGDQCVFPITVPGVPDGSASYTVAVGGNEDHRGLLSAAFSGRGSAATYSADDAKNGRVSLTIG